MPGAWSGSGWQATLQVGGAERSGLGDERAGVVHLAPGVPQEHSPYPPRLQVVDDALTERGLPVGDGFEARVELPHGFVAELEQVRIEERQGRGGRPTTRHVTPRDLSPCVRVFLLLHA